MKFGWLIEYNMFFLKNHTQNVVTKLVQYPFLRTTLSTDKFLWIALAPWENGQYVYCNYLLPSRWRHKPQDRNLNIVIFKELSVARDCFRPESGQKQERMGKGWVSSEISYSDFINGCGFSYEGNFCLKMQNDFPLEIYHKRVSSSNI